MIHTFDAELGRSTRVDARLPGNPWVMRFVWKADGALIESGEYTLPELERLLREMKPNEVHYKRYQAALAELREKCDRAR